MLKSLCILLMMGVFGVFLFAPSLSYAFASTAKLTMKMKGCCCTSPYQPQGFQKNDGTKKGCGKEKDTNKDCEKKDGQKNCGGKCDNSDCQRSATHNVFATPYPQNSFGVCSPEFEKSYGHYQQPHVSFWGCSIWQPPRIS